MMNWAAQGDHCFLKRVKASGGQRGGSAQNKWAPAQQNNTRVSRLEGTQHLIHTASAASVLADNKGLQ